MLKELTVYYTYVTQAMVFRGLTPLDLPIPSTALNLPAMVQGL